MVGTGKSRFAVFHGNHEGSRLYGVERADPMLRCVVPASGTNSLAKAEVSRKSLTPGPLVNR